MSVKKLVWILLLPGLLFSFSAAAGRKSKKSEQTIQTEAGLKIPEWGITVDAFYLPALDQMIPGYRVLNVLIENSRQEPVQLDAMKDKWYIVDHLGRKHKAYNHVKLFDKKLWDKMSPLAKSKLDYPNLVPPGKMVAIDLFFKNDVELNGFHGVEWDSHGLNKNFSVLTEYENELEVKYDTTKIIELPQDPQGPGAEAPQPDTTESEYIKARDQYLQDEEDKNRKVYYITPTGEVIETTADSLPPTGDASTKAPENTP